MRGARADVAGGLTGDGRMHFGPMPIETAQGAILAHAVTGDGLLLRKGRTLSVADIEALGRAGTREIVGARLEPSDVGEDMAAAEIARAMAGPGIEQQAPFTGRVNLHAKAAGLLIVDRARVDAFNGADESLTVATLREHAPIEAGGMVATIKVIPFAADRRVLDAALARIDGAPLLQLAPYRAKRVRLIQTELPGTAAKMLDKTSRITAARVQGVHGTLAGETRCAHAVDPLARRLREARMAGADVILIAGASAITDRRDVLPAGIEAAGGRVLHFGMPVDPGNLLLLGELGGRPVVGLPGCARSPKLNGFDWVLQRLAADLRVSGRELMGMGVGGLLTEIPTRPQPRGGKPAPADATGSSVGPTEPDRDAGAGAVAAVLLAAGRSTRMGGPNKLLADLGGLPLVAHAARAALASRVSRLVVVTGHQADEIEAALRPLAEAPRLVFVRNPEFAQGLATSLRRGLDALGPAPAGVLVMLGDMPRVDAGLIDRLIDAFDPASGREIVVPTRGGRRGNPVLWAARFGPEMVALEGDVGARHLIGEHQDRVVEVPAPEDALLDVDTPAALADLRARPAAEPAA